jgi:hypothetical protein
MPAKNAMFVVVSVLLIVLLSSCALCADATASRTPSSTPQRLRAEAIAKLKALAPTLSDELRATVNRAIQRIETTPVPNPGGMSSDGVRESVRLLMEAIPGAPLSELKNDLREALTLLVTAEGLVAQAAFREADAAAGLNLEFVAQAQENINEARVAFLNGEFDRAVRHYVTAHQAVQIPRGDSVGSEPEVKEKEEEPADVLTGKVQPPV